MSGKQEHRKRNNEKLQYIRRFELWLVSEPPIILLWKWYKWKKSRPTFPTWWW